MKALKLGMAMIAAASIAVGAQHTGHAAAQSVRLHEKQQVSLSINGEPVGNTDIAVVWGAGNRLYAPLELFNHPDIQAEFSIMDYEGNREVSIYNQQTTLSLRVGESFYNSFGSDNDPPESGDLGDAVPFEQNRQVLVPLRFVAEQLGLSVSWNASTNVVNLRTNDEYRSILRSPEHWAAWLSQYPLPDDDPSGKSITEDEIDAYIAQSNTSIVDYAIVSKYAAVVLEISDSDVSMFLIQRLKNGALGEEIVRYGMSMPEDGLTVSYYGDYLGIGIHDNAINANIDSVKVIYRGEQGKFSDLTYPVGNKPGFLIPIPPEATNARVLFYHEADLIKDNEYNW
ncbi:stalk domain-containing protein [Paenibacillus sp. OV219]|uniref:stalk domain-containing protein n=1 Tax=Paenibacillus sp. OV219 TaxID=1884377 RepID=UPI0008C2BCD3|nr:stalk domain-containing protein [Paenibacillus sp. OV219]SEM91304.1 Copper amine oxidase N-terminal domain-containing protein [Paenibacillus sp. OV219]